MLRSLRNLRWLATGGLLGVSLFLSIGVASGQSQPTATPGSPDSTITIDGKQLPAPPQRFGGEIKQLA